MPALALRGETLNVFLHIDAVYSLSVSPVNDNVFASSSDDGRVLIWDTREPPTGGEWVAAETVDAETGTVTPCSELLYIKFFN